MASYRLNNSMNHILATPEVWFVTGSQHLYGPKTR